MSIDMQPRFIRPACYSAKTLWKGNLLSAVDPLQPMSGPAHAGLGGGVRVSMSATARKEKSAPVGTRVVGTTIGQRIRSGYISAGLNRSRFAKLVDVHYTTVIGWENGRMKPSRDNLRLIADVLEVTTGELEGNESSNLARHRRYASFRKFEKSQIAESLSEAQMRTLTSMVFYGMEPTMNTYVAMALGLQSAVDES